MKKIFDVYVFDCFERNVLSYIIIIIITITVICSRTAKLKLPQFLHDLPAHYCILIN